MDVEFRWAMCARRAARQRRAPEHQAEDAEECRAALPAEVDLDAVAPFSWLDEYECFVCLLWEVPRHHRLWPTYV